MIAIESKPPEWPVKQGKIKPSNAALTHNVPLVIELLIDNGLPYIAKDTQIFAASLD